MTSVTRIALAALLAFAAAPPCLAQAVPVQVRMDTATFLYDAEASLVEVYLSLGAASLRYARTADNLFEAVLPVEIAVYPAGLGAPAGTERPAVYTESRTVRVALADPSLLTDGQVVTEQIRMALPPGAYEVSVTVTGGQGEGSTEVELRADLTVPAYAAAVGTAVSALQLATRIAPASDPAAPTVKSGLDIAPNPDAFFGGEQAQAFYYAEVYGAPGAATGGRYTALTYLTRADGTAAVSGTESRQTRAAAPVDVLAGTVDVGAVPTGVYLLRLVVLDEANEAVAQQAKRLFVINDGVADPAATPDVDDDELYYATLGEEELSDQVAHARVLARGRDARIAEALRTDDERRSFLARFWRDQDAPGARPGSARRDFYARLAQVEQQFGRRGTPGYRTDQGRVTLVYGPPSEVVRRTFNASAGSYEVWQYDNIPGEGRSMFVFAYRAGLTRMELVHSDVTGEVTLPDWENRLGNF